jgi:hypothetical protein
VEPSGHGPFRGMVQRLVSSRRRVAVGALVVVALVTGVIVVAVSGDGDRAAVDRLETTTTGSAVPPETGPFPTATRSTSAERAVGVAPLLGVYRGPAPGTNTSFGPQSLQALQDYAAFLGREPELALDFQAVDTWANQEWPDWLADAWSALPQYRLVLGSTGVFPVGGSWAQAAAGEYDDHWRRLGERLVATGQEDAIFRGAHEFNGDWFHYRVGQDDVADFATAWRRWVDVMRSVPGQAFMFDWNPILGTQYRLPHPDDAYPGDEYVDHIALDVYDGGGDLYPGGFRPGDPQPSQELRDSAWETILHGERGLAFWAQFAKDHSKPLAFPEWGIQTWTQPYDGLVHGGGDNAAFVQRMADIIVDPTWNVAYHALWEMRGDGVSDPDDDPERNGIAVGESRRAFLDRFGGADQPSGVAAAPTTTTAAGQAATPPAAPTTTAPSVTGTAFHRGVRFNGPTIRVEGNTFEGGDDVAVISGGSGKCADATTAPLTPAVADAGLAELLRCGLQSDQHAGKLTVLVDVADGDYAVSIYVWENDFPEDYSLALQGGVVTDHSSGAAGQWAKLGPFPVRVSDGRLALSVPRGNASNLAGLEIRTG